jgi:hypothetical protein
MFEVDEKLIPGASTSRAIVADARHMSPPRAAGLHSLGSAGGDVGDSQDGSDCAEVGGDQEGDYEFGMRQVCLHGSTP